MVGQRLTGYLQSCGLEAEDVPKVAATFLGAKYCAWGTSIALAIRFQPLRRLLLTRREALFGRGLAASRPFSQRKRLWLVEALDTAKRRGDDVAGKTLSSARQAFRPSQLGSRSVQVTEGIALVPRARRKSGTAAALPKLLARGALRLRKLRTGLRSTVAAGIAGVKARYRAANYSWKLAGWQLLRTQERQKLLGLGTPNRSREGSRVSWYSWSSAKYWQFSDKLEAAAASNWYWGALTRRLNLNPKGLALGLAEGTILFKFTVPLHMPLMLFLIVQGFQTRHYAAAETAQPQLPVTREEAEEECLHPASCVSEALSELDEASSTVKLLIAASHDANRLVGWRHVDEE